jgi:carbon-monoxide dehydrogenase medium subunit
MSYALHFPRTLDEAFRLLDAGPDGLVLPLAGGTDLLPAMEAGRWRPGALVSLSRLPLDTLERTGQELLIGATLPLRRLERDPAVVQLLPGLVEAVREVGSVPLRHRATLGGNVVRASPASDLLPPLLALEATLDLRSRDGTRRVALQDFVRGSWETTLQPGEIVERIRVPVPRPGSYRWQRVRPANDISQVGVACALAPSDGRSPWRIAAGGVEPHPQRLPAAEAALSHEDPSPGEIDEAVRRAVEGSRPKDDRRAGEEYRRHLLGVLLRRAIESTVRRSREGRGA